MVFRGKLHDEITQKGTLFAILFYALFITFIVQTAALLVVSIITLNLIFLFIALIGVVFGVRYYHTHNTQGILTLAYFFSVLGFGLVLLVPFYQPFILITSTTYYLFIAAHSLLVGIMGAYLFSKTVTDTKVFVRIGAQFSTFIAVTYAIHYFVTLVLTIMNNSLQGIDNSIRGTVFETIPLSTGFSITNTFTMHVVHSPTAFIITAACFIIPYLFFYLKRTDVQPKYFLWYLLPPLVFILLSLLFRSAIGPVYSM